MAFTPPTLGSETIAHIAGFPIRNSMVMAWIAMIILITVAVVIKRRGLKMVPRGLQNLVESVIELLFNFFDAITQDRKQTKKFFPIVATIFLFVILSNWMGLLPGVGPIGIYEKEEAIEESVEHTGGVVESQELIFSERSEASSIEEGSGAEVEITKEEKVHEGEIFVPLLRSAYADVNMTLALALISVILTQIFGIASLGFFGYAGKFFVNPLKNPIGCFVGLLEVVSEFAKLVSFSFRLFGNIFAGEVLLAVIGFLLPFIAPMPFYGLELFVGFVQALVFSVLTIVFMKMAVTSHHEEAH
ncbi:MAG: F0F1 ATP synthase subunit A [Candidatus Gracilibacteria bacterium]